jgi:hypothetical protein
MGLSADPAAAPVQGLSSPNYDEQIGASFTQNFNALAYNVTALAQTDADGYGPAYLLNGLTAAGYWYQVGISYHWPSLSGSYNPTFGFSYEVFGPNGKPVYPSNGGAGLGTFSKTVDSGDSLLLSLAFSGSNVQMLAQDWNTGATATATYSNVLSSSFVGSASSPSNSNGYFTGLMTEWYHVSAYKGNEEGVTYTNEAVALSSAWMWIDEFASSSPQTPLFINQTQTPVVFANDQQLYPFASDGATTYISAHRFITGLLSATASSKVTLVPATTEKSSPSFSATYTLAGQQQSTAVAAGATMLEADPGTSITVSVSASSSDSLERWVFNGTAGTEVTLAAGANATYVYYHLVQQTTSYQVASGGQAIPTSSAVELNYEEAPLVASGTAVPVTARQLLGTAPVVIFALEGSDASINGTIPGTSGERWAASTQSWTVSAPDTIPDPILLYQQYEVSATYSVVGGGTPSQDPEFKSTAFGSSDVAQIASSTSLHFYLDAGSGYSFTSVLNGSTPAERWIGSGGNGSPPSVISSPVTLSEVYTHQYYADLSVNDVNGGAVSQGSGWFDAGSSLSANASANQGWRFESWNGSGVGEYTGTSPSIGVAVMGPLNESATFYVQLAIAADAGTNIAFSYGSATGTVQAGTTTTLYVPPSSNVTLRATPSVFVYSFAMWKGEGTGATKPSLALVVDSPSAVTGTSSYNYPVVLGATIAAAIIILAVSLLIRNRRRREPLSGFTPV